MRKTSKRKDHRMMGCAFALARLNQGLTAENPSVGCVILDADGHIAGKGITGQGGRPHAEEIALEDAGERARGGTAYVTLEPCRQRSTETAACSLLLTRAGLARIVCAIEDPHHLGGGGIAALKAAGVRVDVGLCRRVAARLYSDFFKAVAKSD